MSAEPRSSGGKTILRLLVALAAVAIAAWFGLGFVQDRDTGRAQAIVSAAKLSPARAHEAQSLLSSAGTLNPDRTVDMARAQLASDQQRYAQALAILESVTRAEPLNLLALKQLAVTASQAGHNHLAEVTFRRLVGLVAEPK